MYMVQGIAIILIMCLLFKVRDKNDPENIVLIYWDTQFIKKTHNFHFTRGQMHMCNKANIKNTAII